jgi:protein-S-isoprenylcysteine O-methyltransferase Ste14
MQVSGVVNGLRFGMLFIGTVAIVLLSAEAGWRLGNYRRQRPQHEKDAPVGAVVAAMLGLLAFLLAFTFGMAASRYDTRKQLVLQEANAIGTTYLRAEMLPEPQRSEIRNLLRAYAALRVGGVTSLMTPEVMAQSGALHDRLWAQAVAVGGQSPNSIVVGLFVQSLNEMIDLDETRVTAGRNQIPDSIWLALYVVTILTMMAMGYQFGLTGEHSWPVTILLVLVFTAVLLLIADLDRPQAGWLKVSQQAMIDLINKIGAPAP